MKRLSVNLAVMVFFGTALVGALSDVPPFTCAYRAMVGAAAAYVMASFAGKIVLGIVVDAALRKPPGGQDKGDKQ